MSKIFNNIRANKPRYNKFDLSHERKQSLKMGDLVPMMLQEVIPGDKFQVNSEMLLRFFPMIAPIMHRVDVTTHYFFVPNRLVWNEWEEFITGGREGDETPVSPYVTVVDGNKSIVAPGTLADYLGVPTCPSTTTVTQPLNIGVLPFRGYQLIYDSYYRDQNLTAPIDIDTSSGQVTSNITPLMALRKRAWEKDYFTSALPWSQRGDDVLLPIDSSYVPEYFDQSYAIKSGGGAPADGDLQSTTGLVESSTNEDVGIQNLESPQTIDTTSVTINELRVAIRLQEWLERQARGGARLIETVLSHFGVRSSDARLQRPEYLGGGKQNVLISEVLATATEATEDIPQGNMAGHGISVGNSNKFEKRFEEHGFIIGIMSVLPRTSYQQGLPRHFQRTDKLEYYWPEFAHLGEQEIISKELFHNYTASGGDLTFGYQQRYAEYKYQQSSVHSLFKDTLDYWHLGRVFTTMPVLNTAFIEADPDNRVFAFTPAQISDDEDTMYVQIYNKISALRPMPYHGEPTL